MRIYITADIEGVTGATHWDETDKKNAEFTEFGEQMTAEVGAACEGALNAGASEVWVKDAHWLGRNIIAAKLPREVQLVRAWSGHPFAMMQELDETFHAVLAIGYHSRASSNGSPLAHTMTGNVIHLKINEKYASEFMMSAYTAGLVRVPVAFLSGDAALCREAQALIPDLSTVAVKHGVGGSTVSIHPQVAVERIRAGVEAALKADVSKCRVPMPGHFVVELRYKDHAAAYHASFFPGVNLTGSHTVQFEADDYFEVLRFFAFCIAQAGYLSRPRVLCFGSGSWSIQAGIVIAVAIGSTLSTEWMNFRVSLDPKAYVWTSLVILTVMILAGIPAFKRLRQVDLATGTKGAV